MRTLTLGIIAALLLVACGCGGQPAAAPTGGGSGTQPQAQAPPQVGDPSPDFSFTTLTGDSITLADLKGSPVVVNFWASWCHFCTDEAPHLEALSQQYKSQGLQILGVGTDDLSALRAKAEELKLTYAIGSNREAANRYGVSGIPHTFFIDREGKIASAVVGARPRADLETEIKKIL